MEYKNLEEMIKNYGFVMQCTGGGCFYYERRVPSDNEFSIILFTDHNERWLKQEAGEHFTHEEMMEDHRVEYDIYAYESKHIEEFDLDNERYHAEGLNQDSMGFCTDWTKLETHIQATIELSESLALNPEYVEKYGCTHKQLLDKYKNLDVDEFKELLRIKQNFPTESYCMECGAYTDSVEIENPDCPECGE